MLINKIIRHFSRLKLSVAKFFNFAFSSGAAMFSNSLKCAENQFFLKKKPLKAAFKLYCIRFLSGNKASTSA